MRAQTREREMSVARSRHFNARRGVHLGVLGFVAIAALAGAVLFPGAPANACTTSYTLTTAVSPSGAGTVLLTPPGSTSSPQTYTAGTVVTLTPQANSGWVFDHWEGALGGSANPGTVPMIANMSVTAVFEQQQFTLTTSTGGDGSGTIVLSPSGGVYDAGTQVTLFALPGSDSTFDHWEGDLPPFGVNPVTLLMNANKSVTAMFDSELRMLHVDGPVGGSIEVSPPPPAPPWVIPSGSGDGSQSYAPGLPLSVTATADPVQAFRGWGGDLAGGSTDGLIVDGFEDGDHTSNPAWTGATASFTADNAGGDDYYLVDNTATSATLKMPTPMQDGVWYFSYYCEDDSDPGYNLLPHLRYNTTPEFIMMVINPVKMKLRKYTGGAYTDLAENTAATTTAGRWYDVQVWLDGPNVDVYRAEQGQTPELVLSTSAAPELETDEYRFKIGADATYRIDDVVFAPEWAEATIVMDADKTISAEFGAERLRTLNYTVTGVGSISLSASPVLPGKDYARFWNGLPLDVTATADPGWRFHGWTGSVSSTDNPVLVTMDADKNVTAHFGIHFPDAYLQAAVESVLGFAADTPVLPSHMESLTYFAADGLGIADLTGLEYAVNLNVLNVENNDLSDLSAVAGMTQLEELWAANNKFDDTSNLAVLQGLTSLTALHLGNWDCPDDGNISDLGFLGGLTNLQQLYLGQHDISDISILDNLTNLSVLWLPGNQITDISSLAGLSNLQELYLQGNLIVTLPDLSGLTQLSVLNLAENDIEDISSLAGLSNLHELYLQGNLIVTLPDLSGLTQLSVLNLAENDIEDIGTLVDNPGLGDGDTIHLTGNPLSQDALCRDIPVLKGRGAIVSYDGACIGGDYVAGCPVDLTITLSSDSLSLNALALFVELPEGWTYLGHSLGSHIPSPRPSAGATGTLEFIWTAPPLMIEDFVVPLHVQAPAAATGDQVIPYTAEYRLQGDAIETYDYSVTLTQVSGSEGEGACPAIAANARLYLRNDDIQTASSGPSGCDDCHSADTDGDWAISLSELLRVIQFFNGGGYHCEPGTEDGYASGAGDTSCTPHEIDYNPQDWDIGLSELLRVIQFYNLGGYEYCPAPDPPTEDGFAGGYSAPVIIRAAARCVFGCRRNGHRQL